MLTISTIQQLEAHNNFAWERRRTHCFPISFAVISNVIFSGSLFFPRWIRGIQMRIGRTRSFFFLVAQWNNEYRARSLISSPGTKRGRMCIYYSRTGILCNRVAQLPGETTRTYYIWETKSWHKSQLRLARQGYLLLSPVCSHFYTHDSLSTVISCANAKPITNPIGVA